MSQVSLQPPVKLHPLHRLWRLLPAQRRRALLATVSAWLAPKPDRRPRAAGAGILVAGEVTRASGLGEAARLMHHALGTIGVPSRLIETGVGVPGEAADFSLAVLGPDPTTALAPGAALIMHINAPQMPLAALRLGRGMMRGRTVVGCWVWELPVLPDSWRTGLGFVHEIWVPSRFTADAVASLMAGGRDLKIRVVPYPVAAAPPMPSRLDRAAFALPDTAVIVLVSLSLASSMARKNPFAAIAAFQAAFGDRADRLLLLKLGNSAHYPADLAALRAVAAETSNIRIETRTLAPADNHALTACCDIVLTLHRSEGFGLVPAEAMLLGKPVISTGWSGNMEYMDTDSAALVGYTLIPVVDPRGNYQVPRAVWAEPSITEAASHLTRLAEHAGLRAALGARGRATALQRLGAGPLRDAVAGIGARPANAMHGPPESWSSP